MIAEVSPNCVQIREFWPFWRGAQELGKSCTGRWLRVDRPNCADDKALEADLAQVLGYLNFSAGKPDAKTLGALNRIYARALPESPPESPYAGMPPWVQIQHWLQESLEKLRESNPAFKASEQAAAVIELVWVYLLPSYMDFHRDLLFHQEPEAIFNGFMLGRAIEAVLQQGAPWSEVDRITEGAIRRLNDFVGYRPVAFSRTGAWSRIRMRWCVPFRCTFLA